MTCEVIQNRLLALPNPSDLSGVIRGHVLTCPACQRCQAKAERLDDILHRLPTPDSRLRKEQFLDFLDADGPVIRTRPVLPSSLTRSGAFRPVGQWFATLGLRHYASLAAALLITIAGFWFFTTTPAKTQVEVAAKPRHALLDRCIRHNIALSKASTAPQRLLVFSDWATEVSQEAKDLYKAATRDDLVKLAMLFEATVNQGVIEQARQVDDNPMSPGERRDLYQAAMTRLASVAAEVSELAPDAPPDAQAALRRIASTATVARTTLANLAERKGA